MYSAGQSPNNCMFYGIKPCSRDFFGFTRMICNKHASDIFSIKSSKINLCGRRNTTITVNTITTDQPIIEAYPLMPFPIKLVISGNGPYTYNGQTLCIDKEVIQNVIANFLTGKELTKRGYGSEDLRRLSQVLITYLSSGSFQSQGYFDGCTYTGDPSLNKYSMFMGSNDTKLQDYWAGRKTDETLIGIIDNAGNVQQFPVAKLPLFYQAMLVNFEFSNHTYSQNLNLPGRYLVPNVIADTKSGTIHTFNVTQDNEIYRDCENANYATPLVCFGQVRHLTNSQFAPFQKPEVLPGMFVSVNRPGHCQ
ncbi:VP39 [Penaeus vannamei nudivirus]|nr:hypothetical protein PvSNPV_014 [Penaeus vannamei nucleopolyhedrovirus]